MSALHVIDLAKCSDFARMRRMRLPGAVHIFLLLLVGLMITAVLWLALTRVNLVVHAPGRVRNQSASLEHPNQMHSQEITSDIDGRVMELLVRDGDEVVQGQTLMRIDTQEMDFNISQHRQSIDAAESSLQKTDQLYDLLTRELTAAKEKADAEYREAEETLQRQRAEQDIQIQLASTAQKQAQDHADRTRLLFQDNAVPKTQLVEAESQLESCEIELQRAQLPLSSRQMAVLKHSFHLVEKQFDVRKKKLELEQQSKQDELNRLNAELNQMSTRREMATIAAPHAGTITGCQIQVGDFITNGKTGLRVGHGDGLEVELMVPNDQVALLKTGMRARIKLDAYDYQKYGTLSGIVCYISSDSRIATETGQPTTAHYTVRVRLKSDTLTRNNHRGQVRLGMTGTVEIVTDDASMMQLLGRQIRQTISFK